MLKSYLEKIYKVFLNNCQNQQMLDVAKKAYESVEIVFNSKLRTTAGKATCSMIKTIIINPTIQISTQIFNSSDDATRYNTISHEFAHVIDFYLRNRECVNKGHDHVWVDLHRLCGGDGKQYHNMQVQRNRIKRFNIINVISKQEYVVSSRTFNKIVKANLLNTKYVVKNLSVRNSAGQFQNC